MPSFREVAKGGVWSLLWPSSSLIVSLALALLSSQARQNGQVGAAAILAVLALVLAVFVSVTLVPRLWKRVRRDYIQTLRHFRFTRRGLLYILTVFAIAFASFNTGNNLLILVLSVLLASLVVSGIVANAVLRGLQVSLTLPNDIHAGQNVVFFLTLANLKRRLPSFALRLGGRFESPGAHEETDTLIREGTFPFIRARQKARLRLEGTFPRRGVYTVDGFEVRTSFPFGFFLRGRTVDVNGQVVIFPALLNREELRLHIPFLMEGRQEAPRKGPGTSLYNIRRYQSGDRARFVHWKSTAKLNTLMVKDFALEHDQPIHVVFSTYLGEHTETALGQFERTVSFLATLGKHYFDQGRNFRFTTGELELEVDGKQRDYESLMQYLAQVSPSPTKQIDGSRLGSRSILFSAGDTVSWDGAGRIDYLRI